MQFHGLSPVQIPTLRKLRAEQVNLLCRDAALSPIATKKKDWESGFHLPCRGFEHLDGKYCVVRNCGAKVLLG